MSESFTLGLNAKLYRNTGSYETPTWVVIDNVKDVKLNVEKGEADVTTRGGNGWKQTAATLKDASVEFEMVWDKKDAGFKAIKDAFFNDTTIEVAVMDGDITEDDSEGLRATMTVTTFSRNEPLTEALTVPVTLKPASGAHAPEWLEVDSGSGS